MNRLLLLVCGLLLAGGNGWCETVEGLSPARFEAGIEKALAYLNNLDPDAPPDQEDSLDHALDHLESIFPEAGEGIGPWASWKARWSDLDREDKEALLDDLHERLLVWDAYLSALGETMPLSPAEQDAARRILTEVLAGREFDQLRGREHWLYNLNRYLKQLIYRILRLIFSTEITPRVIHVLMKIVWWGLAIVSLAILYRFLRPYLVRRTVKDARAAPERPAVLLLDDPAILQEKAEEARRSGRLRMALRYYYLAVLAVLERNGLVGYDRSRTNWEYRRELAEKTVSGSLLDAFTGLTALYDRKWYGKEDCLPRELTVFQNGLKLIREAAP